MVDVAANVSMQQGAVVQLSEYKVRIVRQLAEGAFGIVYLAQDAHAPIDVKPTFALKQLICQSKEQMTEAQNELDSLLRFRGIEHIIRLLDHITSASKQAHHHNAKIVMMLFPLCPRGTAWDAIERVATETAIPWPFNEKQCLYITFCTAKALAKIHDAGYSHRDIKPHNILLAEGGVVNDKEISAIGTPTLMDFGSVTKARWEISTKQIAFHVEEEAASKTSAAYQAPELTSVPLPPCQIDERVDVFALGCTLFCLAFGRSPFETPKEGVMRLAILNGKFNYPPGMRNRDCNFSSDFASLVESMLQVDYKSRLFMVDVIARCKDLMLR